MGGCRVDNEASGQAVKGSPKTKGRQAQRVESREWWSGPPWNFRRKLYFDLEDDLNSNVLKMNAIGGNYARMQMDNKKQSKDAYYRETNIRGYENLHEEDRNLS